MKTIIVYVKTFAQGNQKSCEVIVDDNATEDEIEETAKDAMHEMIEWGWEAKPCESK